MHTMGMYLASALIACGLGCNKSPAPPEPEKESASPANSKAVKTKAKDLTAGRSMTEICTNDVLLLTKYSVKSLMGTPLPKACCAKGILPANQAYRCNLDWPSSDVPSCATWSDLRKRLLAAHGVADGSGTPQSLPPLVRENARVLDRWHKDAYACQE